MGTVADLIGTQFDRLTVVAFAGLDKHRKAMWICRCTCGQSTTAVTTELKKGHKRSCGCLKYEAKNIRHGMSGTQEHNIWRSIIQRTSNPKNSSFSYYGGRDIRMMYESFEAFLSDLGPRPTPAHSVDRIDVNGDYAPGNCRWATRAEQMNNKRSNRVVEHGGVRMNIKQWARHLGVSSSFLRRRLNAGWPISKALFSPPEQTNTHKAKLERGMAR